MKDQLIGRVPPQAIDLEKSTLGACMIEKGVISEVAPILGTGDVFYTESHKKIYKAITDIYSEGGDIDMLTVIERVRKNGDSKIVGGSEKDSYYISQLTIQVNSAAHVTTHARILVEKYMMREMISDGGDINRYCYSNEGDPFEALDKLQSLVLKLSNLSNGGKGYEMYMDIARKAMDSLGQLRDGNGKLIKTKTGLDELDKITGGFGAGDLTIVAARPGMGKTAFLVSILTYFGSILNLKGILFSLEMSKERIMLRIFSSVAEIESEKIRDGEISDEEWKSLLVKSGQVATLCIAIDDNGAITLEHLRSVVTKFVIENGSIGFIGVDYLQLMTAKAGNREQTIAKIARGLKNTAKEFGVPLIALAQLSRAVETRGGDKVPMLSDLRESGGIEQDADQVIFIHRPEYYGITEDEEGNSTIGVMNFHVAKNRHGGTGIARQKFIGKHTKVCNWENEFEDSSGKYSEFEDLQPSTEFDTI